MKRILVTGATGFIGRHSLAPLVARGFDVHALCSQNVPVPAGRVSGVTYHVADLLEGDAVKPILKELQPTHLLHFAWYVAHGKFWEATENLAWVAASLRLFQGFSENGGQRFVGAGTCAEYDWTGGVMIENQTPTRPHTLYGISKNALREILEKAGANAGVSVTWGRIFHLYGPGENPRRLIPAIITGLLNKTPVPCTHGRQVRDVMHVSDVGAAFAALADGTADGPFNVATGTRTTIAEIAGMIESLTASPGLLQLGTLSAPVGDPPVLVADTNRLRREGAFLPTIALADGLREYISRLGAARPPTPSFNQ